MKKELKDLFALDKLFCKEAQENGSLTWEKYLGKEALMATRLHEPYLVGRSKISKLIKMIYLLDNIDFTWEPSEGFISDDLSLGITSGLYTRTYKVEDELFTEKGKYITVWKKEGAEWKIAFDMGN